MSILVCGGAGYIGAHVVRLLRQRGDRVVVVDDLSTSNAARIGDTPLVRLDVATDEARSVLSNLMVDEDVTAVIHFSARKQVGESVARPAWYYQQNVGGLANMLLAMDQARVEQMLVTGKPPRPDSERPHARGAIRAAVADWLAGSRHADAIAAVRGAHPRHGGMGALYIVLRRPRAG